MSKQTEALKLALEAQERAWLWMENQADGQSKGGHATFDLMMLREERDALRDSITAIREALAEQPAQQQKEGFASPGGGYVPAIPRPMPPDWKLVPRKATPEMLKAMDECAQEGYDERLYAGMASSVYMAAWDASPVMGTLPEQTAQQQEPVAWPIDGDTAKRIADKLCVSYETVQQVARELAAPQPARQQEPPDGYVVVARAVLKKLGIDDDVIDTIAGRSTPQPAQRKPLTDEEIDKAWRSVDYTAPWEQHRIDIARAIEAAHGIKENT